MTLVWQPHSGGVEHHENPVLRATESQVDQAFAGIVAALGAQDPRFVRRVARRASGHLANVMVLAAAVATLVLGVVPLAVGLAAGVAALTVLGAVGCVVLPVTVPVALRACA